jgi:hypothetical protein
MQARTKPLQAIEPSNVTSFTNSCSFEKPTETAITIGVCIENIEELVNLLQNEAKVI